MPLPSQEGPIGIETDRFAESGQRLAPESPLLILGLATVPLKRLGPGPTYAVLLCRCRGGKSRGKSRG